MATRQSTETLDLTTKEFKTLREASRVVGLLRDALADAEKELAQLRADIATMNELANTAAKREGMCRSWEEIIDRINDKTGGRLKLRGRDEPHDVIITVIVRNVVVPWDTAGNEDEMNEFIDEIGERALTVLSISDQFRTYDIDLDETTHEESEPKDG